MEDLRGRVAVVTGGASGIGLGMAGAFLAEGARVVLADVDPVALQSAVATLDQRDSSDPSDPSDVSDVHPVIVDVADLVSVQNLAAATMERFGAVDVVCNNAGVWTLGYEWETPDEDWRWVVDVNLWGVIHGIRVFVPILLGNARGGHVVNTVSIGGLVAGAGTGPYAATKHAVIGLSKSLRAELEMRHAAVGVTVVCPGRVATPMVGRLKARPLPSELEAVATAMGAATATTSAADAGRIIVEAVKNNAPWAFPGAERHRPLVEREVEELLAAFPEPHRTRTVDE